MNNTLDDLDSLLAEIGINTEQESQPESNTSTTQDVERDIERLIEDTSGVADWIERPVVLGRGLYEQIRELQQQQEAEIETTTGVDANTDGAAINADRVFDLLEHARNQEPPLSNTAMESAAQPSNTSNDIDQLIQETEEAVATEPMLQSVELREDDSLRFSGAEWFNEIQNKGVSIIGLGGIGSWLALFMSRLKLAYIYGMDMDRVERVNLAGQLYPTNSVGEKKTEAIRRVIYQFNESRPSIYMTSLEFTADTNIPIVSTYTSVKNMMLGLDSITARRTVFNKWKQSVSGESEEFIFIDGRLTADKWQIFAIPSKDKKKMEEYEKEWLFPQSEAQALPCSFKQTTYMAAMIASYMCNLFVNFIAESTKPLVPYSIPFMTEFDAQTLELKTYECH